MQHGDDKLHTCTDAGQHKCIHLPELLSEKESIQVSQDQKLKPDES